MEIWATMMVPTDDITKHSYSCNRDMNDGIITATTTTESTTCNEKKLYWRNSNEYPFEQQLQQIFRMFY